MSLAHTTLAGAGHRDSQFPSDNAGERRKTRSKKTRARHATEAASYPAIDEMVQVEVVGFHRSLGFVQSSPTWRVGKLRRAVARETGIAFKELMLVADTTSLDDYDFVGDTRQITAVRADAKDVLLASLRRGTARVLSDMQPGNHRVAS